MKAQLTILGSSSATPTKTRSHSGQVLNFGEDHVLIDCGEGTQNRMIQFGVHFQRIRHVFISHLHGDHILGLPGLINTMSLNQRKKPLNIYGPIGIRQILDVHLTLGRGHLSFDLNIEEFEHMTEFQLKEMSCVVVPVYHRIPCFGFLFKQNRFDRKLNIGICEDLAIPVGKYKEIKEGAAYVLPNGVVIPNENLTLDPPEPFSYGYVTDTLYKEELFQYFQGVQVLYHEATYLDSLMDRANMTFHSTAGQAAKFAKECAVNQLIIGHFSSRYDSLQGHLDEAKEIFENTDVAEEGLTFQIP